MNQKRPVLLSISIGCVVSLAACAGRQSDPPAEPPLEPSEPDETAVMVVPPPPPPPPVVEAEDVGVFPDVPECLIGTPDGEGGCIVTPADRRAQMSIEHQWDHVLGNCPDPELGSFADLWVWEPTEHELPTLSLDLNGVATTFDTLRDFDGTSIIIKVEDADNGDNLAVIKTTSSNTRVDAEIYAFRLATFLGFADIVAPTSPVVLDAGGIEKVLSLIADREYDDSYKERQRRELVAELEQLIEDGGIYQGAIKPWINGMQQHPGLGHRESFGDQPVVEYLRATGPLPDATITELRNITRLYGDGLYYGEIPMNQLAQDLSNLMLMDSLMGQNDRFAGGNVHYRSVTGEVIDEGEHNGRGRHFLGDVRLLALDNGAALRSREGGAIDDLQGDIVSSTRIERFERESVDQLRALARRTLGYGCETEPFDDEVDAIWGDYFNLDPERAERAANYVRITLEYLDELEDDHGSDIYLPEL